MIKQLFNITSGDKADTVEGLFERSMSSGEFYLMIIFSVIMATLGLLMDNFLIIIGSMLIAPILYPILGFAMGISMSKFSIVSKSSIMILKIMLLGIIFSVITTLLFSLYSGGYTREILERTKPSSLSAVVSIVAGLAAAFAITKPKLNEALPGVAVSATLIPPIAVVGIGLAGFNNGMVIEALLLFLINVAGVVFAATIIFSLMNFYSKRNKAMEVIKEGEKLIKKEENNG